jgi:mycothiol system anti-sigma-R factor
MSCGSPHETDCREVIEEVYLYLDGEMDSLRRDVIREHLDECAPCLRKFGIEQAVKVLVARSCGRDRAPESLRLSVMAKLKSVRVEIDHAEFRAE